MEIHVAVGSKRGHSRPAIAVLVCTSLLVEMFMHVYQLRPVRAMLIMLLLATMFYGVVAIPSVHAAGVDIKINFQTLAAPVPAGYLRDSGEGYAVRAAADQGSSSLTYGWVAPNTNTPRDLTTMGRDRNKNLADQRLDTLVHMQMVSAPGSWEMAIANGNYDVTVAAGDSDSSGSADLHTIRVEGTTAISQFSPSGGNGTFTRHATAAVRVTVGDGRLTIDATGGTNTKINYVDIASASTRPSVTTVNPANGAVNVLRNIGIAANVTVTGGGINSDTVNVNTVRLLNMSTGAIVPAGVNTSGGGDIITLTPSSVLDPNTQYRFDVTDGVKAGNGVSFLPFSSTFTTGTGGGPGGGGASVAFTVKRNVASNPTNDLFSSIVLGPDGKMYVSSLLGTITRYNINPTDGTLTNPQIITTIQTSEGTNRAIIGIAFDPAASAGNLVLWVSHNGPYVPNGAPDWTGKISRLSGPDLATKQDYVINLPHSAKDHMVNSLAFGPDGKLYVPIGSNSAMGKADGAWGNRPERLLSGAVLQIDTGAISSPPLNAKTETDLDGPGSYDPFAANAPVKIYATGVRNAYDLVWHTNGSLYAPTNGSAAGGNTPAIPGTLPPACNSRINGSAYTSPTNVPGLTNVPDQHDFLFRVVPGGYYGHPNPLRCEWILNGGNPTDSLDPGEVVARDTYVGYPVGTQPDPNYRGAAYDFGEHVSPNGAIEYKSNAFGGKLKGKLLVARYSLSDDIIVLTPGGPNNDIVEAQVGLPGLTGLNNPLDLAENPATGDVYVVELGSVSRINLLRPLGGSVPQIEVTPDRIVTNDKQDANVGRSETVTIRNSGTATLTVSSISIIGANADQFQIVGSKPTSLAAGASAPVQVAMKATGTGADLAGPKDAVLQVNSNDPLAGTTEIGLRGLATLGNGGTNEPSLQWILDTYQIPVNVGDDNPKDNIINSDLAKQRAPLLGDEVDFQQFRRFDNASPVLIEPLAVFGPTSSNPVLRFGWYTSINAAAKNELFSVSNSPSANGQRLNPVFNTGAVLDFDPGTSKFGFYSIWPFFDNRELFSEDALNTFSGAIPHHVRVYPLKNTSGTTVPNAYVVAFEENTSGFDYQDVVLIVRNVKSANTVTAPLANAGNDQTVVVGTPITINGVGSDAEGESLTFNWQQTGGPAVSLSGSGSSRAFTPTSIGTYEFTLKVTDPGGLFGEDSVIITVTDPATPNNQTPTANAGSDQTVRTGTNVTLNGSGTDVDGTILGYRWQQTSGLAVTLSSDADAQLTFVAPDQPTVLTFNLVVTDNQGAVSVADEVRIVVTDGSVGNAYRVMLPLISAK